MAFESIAGQQQVKEHFARALRDGALDHAYLLAGREGLAKTAFALELAVALVTSCGGCGDCSECSRARRGVHPDLHVLEREGDQILVGQVEPLIADLSLRPFTAGHRVWVLPEVDCLNAAAANKLLKSLEEPPDHVVFLLVTDHLERVLPTIVSRCQLVEFHPVGDEVVAAYLRESRSLDGVEVEALARLSGGAVERADRLADDACGPGRRGAYLAQASILSTGRRAAAAEAGAAFIDILGQHQAEISGAVKDELARRLAELEQQFQDKRDLKWHTKNAEGRAKREERRLRRLAALDALDVLVSWVRDLWVVACGASEVLCNCDREAELLAAAVATPEHYARVLAVAAQTRKDLYLNIDQKLALQALFARFEEVAESA
jgi:DNA polymerase-3 subunit delta'